MSYMCSPYRDKITQHALHQTLRSTIKVRKSMHSIMYYLLPLFKSLERYKTLGKVY